MSQSSLTMKANSLGEDCDKLVQQWKGKCEIEVEKQNCFKLVKSHLQDVAYLPQLPSIGEVREFISGWKEHIDSQQQGRVITDRSSDCSTLDLSGLNLCCNFSSQSVLDDTCSMLQDRGVGEDVVIQCLENITQQGTDEKSSMLDALLCCAETKPCYPSYQIIGDNLDLDVKVRHMDTDNKNKSFHWFNLVAFRDQGLGNHLPDVHEKMLSDVPISVLLPSKENILHLKQHFVVLWSRVIVKHLKAFAFLKTAVIYHIPHAYSEAITQPVEEVSNKTILHVYQN